MAGARSPVSAPSTSGGTIDSEVTTVVENILAALWRHGLINT